MARAPGFRCTACGAAPLRWEGRCSKCGEFGTVQEAQAPAPGMKARGRAPVREARPVSQIAADRPATRLMTGLGEFDRVVGGGLVAGQVLLLTGEPGAGKSTLLLAVANAVAASTGGRVLYVSGEESAHQVALRASRIGAADPGLLIADDTDLGAVIGQIQAQGDGLALVIIDSVQTIASAEVDGRAGGVTQVMEVAQALTRTAKTMGIPFCLVGQVTKDASVAGPRALEHTVDTTLSLDGDRHTSLRLLRAVKNRFGPTDEVACFEQTDAGMREVADPSALFRGEREQPVAGTCVTVTLEGRRPLLAEIQALISPTTNPNPRRGVSGLDSARTAMLIAVTERAARLRLFDKDVFVATAGGMRLTDPGCDLAVCAAIASSGLDAPLAHGVAAIGEVALSGDIRPVQMVAQRIAEAARLGYSRILVPPGTTARLDGRSRSKAIVEVDTIAAALGHMVPAPRSP